MDEMRAPRRRLKLAPRQKGTVSAQVRLVAIPAEVRAGNKYQKRWLGSVHSPARELADGGEGRGVAS